MKKKADGKWTESSNMDPEGKVKRVIIDGMLSKDEWDDALRYSITDTYEPPAKIT